MKWQKAATPASWYQSKCSTVQTESSKSHSIRTHCFGEKNYLCAVWAYICVFFGPVTVISEWAILWLQAHHWTTQGIFSDNILPTCRDHRSLCYDDRRSISWHISSIWTMIRQMAKSSLQSLTSLLPATTETMHNLSTITPVFKMDYFLLPSSLLASACPSINLNDPLLISGKPNNSPYTCSWITISHFCNFFSPFHFVTLLSAVAGRSKHFDSEWVHVTSMINILLTLGQLEVLDCIWVGGDNALSTAANLGMTLLLMPFHYSSPLN